MLNFYENIQDPTIVDFYATWCGPCKTIKPVVEEIEDEYKGRVNVLYIDIDEHTSLAQEMGVTSIPSILFFNKGELIDGLQGVVDKKEIEEKIKIIM